MFPCLQTIGSGFYQFILILSIDSLRTEIRTEPCLFLQFGSTCHSRFQGAEQELDTKAFSGDQQMKGANQMPRYGTGAKKTVGRAMHKLKKGSLKSGKGGKRVKSRKQAIAIGLSEARRKGAKVPSKSE
jgi:hypothetical protein